MEARGGVADVRRAAAAHGGRNHRAVGGRRAVRVRGQRQGHRVCRLPAGLRGRQRRPVGRTRRAGDDPAEAERGRSGARARPARREPLSQVAESQGPRDLAAGALHRSFAREAPGRGRHRPSLDLRADRGHDSAARLREQAGQGARAELHRLCRHPAAARAFRRLRRRGLHRRDGRDARRDLERRRRTGSISSRRSTAATASTPASRRSWPARNSRSTTR